MTHDFTLTGSARERPPVLIVGAHRSGTSATAVALQSLGLLIGQRLDEGGDGLLPQGQIVVVGTGARGLEAGGLQLRGRPGRAEQPTQAEAGQEGEQEGDQVHRRRLACGSDN